MKKIIILISILLFISCKSKSLKNEKDINKKKRIKSNIEKFTLPIEFNKIWETESTLKVPESIVYDEKNSCYYVSNINGESDAFDNNGFISKLDTNGNIINLKWIRGLNAPKGMGIYKNNLYITDIDKVIKVDIKEKMIINEFLIDGKFLNDISISNNGKIYVSDMTGNKIYIIQNDKSSLWLDSPEINTPNGLLVEEDRLLVGQGTGDLLSVNLEDKSIKKLDSGFGATEGITKGNRDFYFISNWFGAVYFYDKKGNTQKIFDTKLEKYETADISFNKNENVLLIPTFSGNTIVAYEIKYKN